MQRYTQHAFPPYQYTPGKNPHPIIHEQGHSYNAPEQSYEFDPANWQQSQRYLYGIDLINYEYFWEAHEALEDVWNCVPRASDAANYLQALIMLAVAQLHVRRVLPRAAIKVAGQGLGKLADQEGDLFGTKRDDIRNYLDEIRQQHKIKVHILLEGM